MAQIPPPPAAFSPPPTSSPSTSPTSASIYPPPLKRQRISPGPGSPYALPVGSPNAFQNTSVPTPTQMNGAPAMPQSGLGAMGPPSRPVDKPTSTVELTDVLAQAGVDVMGEENALTAEFSSSTRTQDTGSFTSNNASSFNSATSAGSDSGTLSASNSLPNLSQGSQVAQLVPREHVDLSGPPQAYKTPEQVADEEWQAALRRHAHSRSFHLTSPLLYGDSLRRRIYKRSYENGVRLPQDGYSEVPRQPPPQRIRSTNITGTDGTSISAVTVKYLDRAAPLAEILALLSLATGERIRGLVEDATALAKGRRLGAQGVVPQDWADVAQGNGIEPATVKSAGAGRAALKSSLSPVPTNPLKRPHDATDQSSTSKSDDALATASTVTFPNEFAKSLRGMNSSEREAEEWRLAKRARRSSSAPPSNEGSKAGSVAPGTPGSTGPGTVAPEAEPKKLTKKEQAKQQNARLDVAHQQQSANNTALMMLGGGGSRFGKKKSSGYSWMTGGAGGMGGGGGSGHNTPGRLNTGAGGAGNAADGGSPGGAVSAQGKRIGDWREDKERGAGVQLRDWVSVLEADGKEQRSLAHSLLSLK